MKTLAIICLSVALSVAISVPATLALTHSSTRVVTKTVTSSPSAGFGSGGARVFDEYSNMCDTNARVDAYGPGAGGPLVCPASLHFFNR